MNYAKKLLRKLDEGLVISWERKSSTKDLKGGENVRFVKGHEHDSMIGIVIDTTGENEISVLLGTSTRVKVKLSEVEFRK